MAELGPESVSFDSCYICQGLYQFHHVDTLESSGQGDDGLNVPWKQRKWERWVMLGSPA